MNEQAASDLGQIEISIDEAKQCIEFRDRLHRLEQNEDFKAIFLEDYMNANVIRLVRVKASPTFQKEEQQNFVLKQLDAVGQLNQYLQAICTQGQAAEDSLTNDMQEREQLLSEGI
jgi:hypothetical protein